MKNNITSIESETYYVKYKVNIIQNNERTNQENMPRKSIASKFGNGISSVINTT